ncbi:receptor-like protein EIX2 [Salvia hispanica]|uniref:receptor-like protein EIX2 n=1 Tax=Salvia hispanica TaxID=49212 RepID=UPI00200979B2|nr:receptor-like protein EIX2 [Salvia hispanica]
MGILDSLDLSHHHFSGKIPTSLAEIHTLGVLDLSNNNLCGKISTSTQLQSFNASSYAGNDGLCGNPLPMCIEHSLRPSTTNPVDNTNEKDGNNFSFMQEVGISMGFGFIFGFWGVIGSFILKKSWRVAFSKVMFGDAKVRCIESEREALLSFKKDIIDENEILSSWQSNECCEWHGVECSDTGHVTALRICNMAFGGKIGSSLLALQQLNTLSLGGNDFGGFPIPEFIGSMKQLQHLQLSSSNFRGIIPPQLGNLTNLRSLDLSFKSLSSISLFPNGSVWESLESLDLSYNNLTGSIPDLRAFPSLTELVLSGNNFTSSIPISIGQLSHIRYLDLSSNSLEGLVSESHFSKLHKLESLDLSFNPLLILDIAPDWSPPFQLSAIKLAGCNVGPYFPNWIRTQINLSILDHSGANITDEAPKWLWSVSPSLKSLYLSYNQISGTVPKLSSTSIKYIDLSYNQLSGPITLFTNNVSENRLSGNMFSMSISSICKTLHDEVKHIDLSNNQLAGEVPRCWEKMAGLLSLSLASNSFSGEIPLSLGVLHNLGALQMHGNNLSGELPYDLRHCQELKIIDVGENKLTGEIPSWIGQLDQMQIINLHENKLHGSIPQEICDLISIQILDLSLNNLSGIIPDCFDNFNILSSKYALIPSIYGNFFGQIDAKIDGYTVLNGECFGIGDRVTINAISAMDIHCFNGKGLRSLNLSRNSLNGYIIPDIGKMEMLESLDLSHNKLFGKIPTSLAQINTLGVLDLSNNNLSGKIHRLMQRIMDYVVTLCQKIMENRILQFVGCYWRLDLYQDYCVCTQNANKAEILMSGDANAICIEWEREDLLSFKNGLIDEDGILSSWQSNECCEWHGVECSNTTGHVITLDLQCNLCTLQGEVRSSLLELHHLNHLDLSRNDFGGIPIPEFIYSMKQLQHLHLSFSNFSTTIPPQLGNLTNLRSLDLSGNGIRNIPPQLWNLTNLRSLNLGYNSLDSESLSLSISSGFVLESLEILNLAENQLNGLMFDLRAFPSLTNLYLMGNNFIGSIHVSIGQLSNLQDLFLQSNSLEGLVSEYHFTKLNKLKRLDLSFNSLIMDIAPDWNPPFQLSSLSLAGCNVGPYFPNWFRTQRNLAYLDLRCANIQEEVPKWLWSTSSINYLYLSDNQISGMIPNLSSASILSMDLSNNQLSGPIPLFPSKASRILLSGNMLSGSISSICNTRTKSN